MEAIRLVSTYLARILLTGFATKFFEFLLAKNCEIFVAKGSEFSSRSEMREEL